MPEERKWQEWLERLHNLRRDKRGSHERPHKPVLLPSLLDLLDRGQVKNNQVALAPELVNTFRRYFDVVRREDDRPTIENPFHFLSGDGFWKIEKAGQGPLYQPGNASSPPSMSILRTVAGHFDPELCGLIAEPRISEATPGSARHAVLPRRAPGDPIPAGCFRTASRPPIE